MRPIIVGISGATGIAYGVCALAMLRELEIEFLYKRFAPRLSCKGFSQENVALKKLVKPQNRGRYNLVL